MDESYTGLPTSHLLGSVPAVINEEKISNHSNVPGANLQNFPPTNNGRDKERGYQTLGGTSEERGQQPKNNWNGYFSISSYTQYFDVDTDDVYNRLISSLNPISGDFFTKIDANPDLYGAVWISFTLVFVLAFLGNCATYLTNKQSSSTTTWSFDVSYFSVAALSVYIYTIVVPLAFYFVLQYLGSSASLVRFWCMWGYSLFIFILSSFLLIIPVEILRWIIITCTGAASASFIALNIKSHIEGNEAAMVAIAAFVIHFGFAIFLKLWFFL